MSEDKKIKFLLSLKGIIVSNNKARDYISFKNWSKLFVISNVTASSINS